MSIENAGVGLNIALRASIKCFELFLSQLIKQQTNSINLLRRSNSSLPFHSIAIYLLRRIQHKNE